MINEIIHRFSHRGKKDNDYFEGWYVRILDPTSKLNLACIFAYTKYHRDPHAFIQFYDGNAQTNRYYRFDINHFNFSEGTVSIADNTLSPTAMTLNLDDVVLSVELSGHQSIVPKSAMGYLANVPLQCYQEVIFMEASAVGRVNNTDFQAKAYMEKTFGRRFPKRWFWLQSNHFDPALKFTLAGGHVPTLFFKPFGFFAIVQFAEEEWVFGTYNGARCRIEKTENVQRFTLTKGTKKVFIEAKIVAPVKLVGPSDKGNMNLDVYEDLNAEFSLKIYQDKELIYQTKGTHGGYEWMFD